jgi:hypothetical protein
VLDRFKSFWKQSVKVSKGTAFSSNVTFFLMSSASRDLFSLRAIFTLGRGKCYKENWDCLDKSGRILGIFVMMWVSAVSAHPWGTNFMQIFLFRKFSWMIWRIVSLLMFKSSAIILRAYRRSGITISRTFPIVYGFRETEGRPHLGSSWRSSHGSLNRLNHSDHSDALLQLKASSPQAVCNI